MKGKFSGVVKRPSIDFECRLFNDKNHDKQAVECYLPSYKPIRPVGLLEDKFLFSNNHTLKAVTTNDDIVEVVDFLSYSSVKKKYSVKKVKKSIY